MEIEKAIKELLTKKHNLKFKRLIQICDIFFEKRPYPNKGGSHFSLYKTPWQGDPRINLQESENGCCKAYQIEQVVKALRKLQKD